MGISVESVCGQHFAVDGHVFQQLCIASDDCPPLDFAIKQLVFLLLDDRVLLVDFHVKHFVLLKAEQCFIAAVFRFGGCDLRKTSFLSAHSTILIQKRVYVDTIAWLLMK